MSERTNWNTEHLEGFALADAARMRSIMYGGDTLLHEEEAPPENWTGAMEIIKRAQAAPPEVIKSAANACEKAACQKALATDNVTGLTVRRLDGHSGVVAECVISRRLEDGANSETYLIIYDDDDGRLPGAVTEISRTEQNVKTVTKQYWTTEREVKDLVQQLAG